MLTFISGGMLRKKYSLTNPVHRRRSVFAGIGTSDYGTLRVQELGHVYHAADDFTSQPFRWSPGSLDPSPCIVIPYRSINGLLKAFLLAAMSHVLCLDGAIIPAILRCQSFFPPLPVLFSLFQSFEW